MASALLRPVALPARPQEAAGKSATGATSPPSSPSQTLNEALKGSYELYTKHQDGAAQERVQRALTLAREETNAWGEGEAHRILGLIALRAAKYPEAEVEFNQALALFESVPSPPSIARTHVHLAAVLNYMGRPAEAIELYRKALSEFEEHHALSDQAGVLENLLYVDTLPASEKDASESGGWSWPESWGTRRSKDVSFITPGTTCLPQEILRGLSRS